MIAADMKIMDLDPHTWVHLEEVWQRIHPPKKRIYILIDGGAVRRGMKDSGEEIPLQELEQIDTRAVQKHLFEHNPEIDQILLLTLDGIRNWAGASQLDSSPQLDTDLFISRSEERFYNTEDIQVVERESQPDRRDFWTALRALAEEKLESSHTLVLILKDQEKLFFHVVLHFENHQLKVMTTLDHFPEWNKDLQSLMNLTDNEVERVVSRHFPGAVTLLFYGKEEFYRKMERGIFKTQ